MIFTIMLGAVTVWFHQEPIPKNIFGKKTIVGAVHTVDRRLDKTIVTVEHIQITTTSQIDALPGDTIKAIGVVEQPKDFMTNTDRLFPYQNYLLSKGIYGIVKNADVTVLFKGHFSLNRIATKIRFGIATIFKRYIRFPVDGIVAGMLVGYQGGVPKNIQDLFRTTGVLHVLVLSGENITLLATFLFAILKVLPFKVKTFFTGIAVILIVFISGAGVAAVRAGIMAAVMLSSGIFKRTYSPFRALTLSILFFFFISPETVFIDPGFHLSVLATLFMIVVAPKVQPSMKYGEVVVLAIGMPLFMLPYTMYFSGLLSSVSPFANIMMMVITPVLMLAGALLLCVSWLTPFAQIVGTVTSMVGSIILKVLHFLNTFPQLNTPPIDWRGVLASYLLFFSIVFRKELTQFWCERRNSFLPHSNSSERGNQ
ncbi:MAG TPA: ComEC/Rec2 family competence protein [Candidatus Paceibacterota bacterium]|nr:ComEC/Rec2 family competence protein [Candidatus Paceibacterota bacterium]